MFIKYALFALLTFLLAGCITSDVVVSLNPDGSGTVDYVTHFDRAPDEMREQIREQQQNTTFCSEYAAEDIRELYPEPHFKLVLHEEDPERLTTRIKLQFSDINALLSERKTAHLGLEHLDFSVDGENLIFTIKEKKVSQSWPKKYDEYPGLERICVLNTASGEEVVFERELSSETEAANWSGTLSFPGHRIVRKQNVQVFHDYPVVQLAPVRVKAANWSLRNHNSWSSLTLALIADFPASDATYVGWDKPAVLSGHFLPDAALQVKTQSNSGKGKFEGSGTHEVKLEFNVPTNRVDALASSLIRLTAYRCKGSQLVEVGVLKPDTEYSFGDFTLKTDDLGNNRVRFRLKGEVSRLKNVFIETQRGNRFALKWASSSGDSKETSVSYWEKLPLEGCTLWLELYEELEPCYVDLPVPALDLMRRSWRVDAAEKSPAAPDWKIPLRSAHPELFETAVPEVTAALFEDKELYKTYFAGLTDEQLMPAMVQVVDFMILHNPDKGQYWIQDVARSEIGKRREFLESNRQLIAEQLFSIYLNTPEDMICLSTFFSTLRLRAYSQPLAIQQLEGGNIRFARDSFFGPDFTEHEILVLQSAFASTDNWMEQNELLGILKGVDGVDTAYLLTVFNDRSLSEHVRPKLVAELAERQEAPRPWLMQVVQDSSDHVFVRQAALQILIQEPPFPVEIFNDFLAVPDGSGNALRTLDSFLRNALRETKDDPQARLKMAETLKPLLPMLEDLSEQLRSYDAKGAVDVLDKIKQLDAAPPVD